jgi:hypothetical protein
MKVKQISIFLENRSGRLADVLRVLGDAGINIRALSLADTSDFGILRLIVDDVERGVEVLRAAGRTVTLTDVLALEIPDVPGGVAGVLGKLAEVGLNVEYMYAFVSRVTEKAIVIFRFEDVDEALRLMQGAGIKVLSRDALAAL